ncbi:MAG: HAMP domain-containing protein [Acidobacteria bacterium]|nr:HAMP domain-containing protein [Acidobacteriota bacterium]
MDITKIVSQKISLKWKIAIGFAILTFIFVFFASLIFQNSLKKDIDEAYSDKIANFVKVAEYLLKTSLKQNIEIFPRLVSSGLTQDSTINNVFIFNADRRLLVEGSGQRTDFLQKISDEGFPISNKLEEVEAGKPVRFEDPNTDNIYWTSTVTFENEVVGYVVLKTGTDYARSSVSIIPAILWALIFALMSAGLGLLASLIIVTPISSLTNVVSQVSMGLVESRSRVETGDELEELGNSLNEMLDRIGVLIATEADRDRMQANIMNLLETVDAASKGNLTVRGIVTEDALGSVADAYNVMLESISNLIKQVSESGVKVSRTTQEILMISEEINTGADNQARELDTTADLVEKIANSMDQISGSAVEAADSANIAAKTALEGSLAVNNTIQGMNRIRNNVQTTSKKIKTLGEKSLEINAIVEVIDEISAQTNMLALNAAIEAARAGEYGRGFAVVANEIRTLAERSSEATTEIADLVKSIQTETSEAVTAMEESTEQVEIGVRLADDAGKSLSEIQNVVNQAAALIQEISFSAQQQVEGTEQMVRMVSSARNVAQSTSVSIQQSIELMQELAASSNALSQSISLFKV